MLTIILTKFHRHVIVSTVCVSAILMGCKDNDTNRKKFPEDGEGFITPGENVRFSTPAPVKGNLQGSIGGRSWKLKSGAVTLLEDYSEGIDIYTGLLFGFTDNSRSIVCDDQGSPNFKDMETFDGVLEVKLPAKSGKYKSTSKNMKTFDFKIYTDRNAKASWEIEVKSTTSTTYTGTLKVSFDKNDEDQIEGDFSIEICRKKKKT
jgi:hypothetical protein